MHYKNQPNSSIHIILPIILFCIFAVCAILVVLFGARVYSSMIQKSDLNYTARTSLSYIREKVRQNENTGSIAVRSIGGNDCLVLKEHAGGTLYCTYIYVYDGNLCELYTKARSKVHADAGTAVIPLRKMNIKKINDHLLSIKCTDNSGTLRRSMIKI